MFQKISPLWPELECLLALCKLWGVFTFNSPNMLCQPLWRFTLSLHTLLLKDSRKLLSGFLSLVLCIAPSSTEPWLLNSAGLLCFALPGDPLSAPKSWKRLWAEIQGSWRVYSMCFPLWGNPACAVIVKCYLFCLIVQCFTVGGQVWSLSLCHGQKQKSDVTLGMSLSSL